ncbi:MAG TPA: DUF1361 domain-containing protein [Verrucomicrobiae bacterium]
MWRKETAVPMLAVIFASGVSVALVLARMVWTGHTRQHGFLIWNLFLAWLPLVFALLAAHEYRANAGATWKFRGLAAAWLLFFPNAPYIFTDLVHLTARFQGQFWVDLVLILICALTGLVLGFLSLFLMQGIVSRMFGRAASWLFVGIVAGLSGFGIYLGRFLRFNSWDIIYQPVMLWRGIGNWAADPLAHTTSYAFPILFAMFLFITYLMLYALTHLNGAHTLLPHDEGGTNQGAPL